MFCVVLFCKSLMTNTATFNTSNKVTIIAGERERGRERGRQTDRDKERQTDRDRERQRLRDVRQQSKHVFVLSLYMWRLDASCI